MEKGIFTFNEIEDIAKKATRLEQKFELVAGFLLSEYDCKVYFCNIIGKRWSYFAGKNYVIWLPLRIELIRNFGIILEDKEYKNAFLETLTKDLNLLIEHHDFNVQAEA